MAKHEVHRTKMTEDEAEKFLKKYLGDRDLKGAESNRAIRMCAATRWAALTRYSKKLHKPKKAKKTGAKKGAKKGMRKAA